MKLHARNTAVKYEPTLVFSDLSVTVESGEILVIIGPSGVGKTTLLRLLALGFPPDTGTIEVDETDAWAVSEADRLALRRRIGMMFQEPGLFNASVGRNVEYGLRVRRSWRDRLQDELHVLTRANTVPPAVHDSLELVGLDDQIGQPAPSLSGGEAQRVAFARAIAYSPDALLLDEPASNLDPQNTAVLEDAIGTARDRGLGVVVATHDMHQAERIGDRIAVFLDGQIVETGPPSVIFNSPTDERTQKFIDGELIY